MLAYYSKQIQSLQAKYWEILVQSKLLTVVFKTTVNNLV